MNNEGVLRTNEKCGRLIAAPTRKIGFYAVGAAISRPCRNYRPRTKQQTPEKPAAANLFTIHCSLAALYAGKLSLISVPFPSSLCILISALWKAAACFTIDSPKPVPPIAFEWLLSTR